MHFRLLLKGRGIPHVLLAQKLAQRGQLPRSGRSKTAKQSHSLCFSRLRFRFGAHFNVYGNRGSDRMAASLALVLAGAPVFGSFVFTVAFSSLCACVSLVCVLYARAN